MRSLRIRLFALWVMLAASGAATGFLLFEFYRQSANAQVGRAEDIVSRACHEISDHYHALGARLTGSGEGRPSGALKDALTAVVAAALAHAPGVEGGIWSASDGALAYAFPTYEGTGPKTDVPAAELATIQQINADASRGGLPVTIRQIGRAQVLAINACPLDGPLRGATAWAMTRVFTGQGAAYNQLLIGLAILAVMVLGSAAWLGRILYSWSRKLLGLEAALVAHHSQSADLPQLPLTGERELDRFVFALNAAGARLAEERRRASASERLAAVGRLAAGLAHEIRNPIAAMRLKAENALAAGDEARRVSALDAILGQIARLDGLLRDLLAMTQRREPKRAPNDLGAFLERTAEAHRELAASKGLKLAVGAAPPAAAPPLFDAEQMHRALDNLILNAIENTPPGGVIAVAAARSGDQLQLRVHDSGHGVPDNIRERLFEPFVTGRSDGTGLGLAEVREIARAHGGDARLVATRDGAEFVIEVPWQTS